MTPRALEALRASDVIAGPC
ncbi:MAG: hypothetical protein ACYSTQ_06565 [Planctomycetota bacterium]